jgi:hypothetical protein
MPPHLLETKIPIMPPIKDINGYTKVNILFSKPSFKPLLSIENHHKLSVRKNNKHQFDFHLLKLLNLEFLILEYIC